MHSTGQHHCTCHPLKQRRAYPTPHRQRTHASIRLPIIREIVRIATDRRPPIFTRFRRRTRRALRGISDAAGVAIAHEIALTLLNNSPGALYPDTGLAECGLLFGGIFGIWTACLGFEHIQRRTRRKQNEFVDELNHVVFEDWFKYGSVREDVEIVLNWLGGLDELEGGKVGERLWRIVEEGSVEDKCIIAKELRRWPARSNVVLGVLRALVKDSDVEVRALAQSTLDEYDRLGVVQNAEVPDIVPARIRNAPLAASLGTESSRAYLDKLYLDDTYLQSMQEEELIDEELELEEEPVESKIEIKAPILDSLQFPGMHVLCTAVVVPLAYEYYCLMTGLNDPLRFLGLGWLFAICGLAVYPRSLKAWKFIERACREGY